MITSRHLRREPDAFASPTGMTVAVFDASLPAEARCHPAATHTGRGQTPCHRAPGAGPPRARTGRPQLLTAPVRLRVYPTYGVLGLPFHPERGDAGDNVQDVPAALKTSADFSFERPTAERKKPGTVVAVIDTFPQVRPVIDPEEQEIERPQGADRRAMMDGRGPTSTDHRATVWTWAAPRRPLHERSRHE